MSLLQEVDAYLGLKWSVGYKYDTDARVLRSYADHARLCGDEFLIAERMIDWAGAATSVGYSRQKIAMLRRFALWMHAEDPRHEIPPPNVFGKRSRKRRIVHLFTDDEIESLLSSALMLEPLDSIRPHAVHCILGLLASAGLRRSEAVSLLFSDLRFHESAILISNSKFRKSRLLPVHDSVMDAIDRYLVRRRRVAQFCNHVFVDANHLPFRPLQLWRYFFDLVIRSGIAKVGDRPFPTLHGLRHTFAVRYLEKHVNPATTGIPPELVALARYMGHESVYSTYWYLQATPTLLEAMAMKAEFHLFGQEEV